MERCVGCQYYDRNHRNGDAKSSNAGQCRRAAPMLSPINQKSYMIEGVWPTVRDDDWCGEWKALVRRVDPARLSDVLGSPLTSLPTGAVPGAPTPNPPPAMPPMAPPRVSVQAARAALSSLGIDSRSAGATVSNLTGTGNGDD